MNSNELYHFGIKGMKWGVRRFQDKNGRLTNAGKKRYSDDSNDTDKTENIKKRGLTDKQKKYIKIGAATVINYINLENLMALLTLVKMKPVLYSTKKLWLTD